MTSCCHRRQMRWRGATGVIARCKNKSTGYARTHRSVHAWRWTCGEKLKAKAVSKPSPHSIRHGLDKPGVFTPTTTSRVDILKRPRYATPAYPIPHQEAAH